MKGFFKKIIKENRRELVIKIALMFVTMAIMAVGNAFFYTAQMGESPSGMFYNGLAKATGLTYGRASMFFSILCFATVLLFYRSSIYFATVMFTFLQGPITDFAVGLMLSIRPEEGFALWARILFPFVAVFFYALGLAVYLPLQFGFGPIDGVIFLVGRILRLAYNKTLWIYYAVMATAGFLLGAPLGFGMAVSLFLTSVIFSRLKAPVIALINRLTGLGLYDNTQ